MRFFIAELAGLFVAVLVLQTVQQFYTDWYAFILGAVLIAYAMFYSVMEQKAMRHTAEKNYQKFRAELEARHSALVEDINKGIINRNDLNWP